MPPTAEVEPMSEPSQDTLFALPTDDHLRLIVDMHARRDEIADLAQKLSVQRLALVEKFNEADAARDDAVEAARQLEKRGATEAEQIRARAAIFAADDRRRRFKAEHDAIAERKRAMEARLKLARAECDLAVHGVQREWLTQPLTIDELAPERAMTARDARSQRQERVREGAVRALRAKGGKASCVDLAALLGLSSHGIGGLIDGDPRLVKYHDGRQANLETWYRLAEVKP